jgi:hypothetical protein
MSQQSAAALTAAFAAADRAMPPCSYCARTGRTA